MLFSLNVWLMLTSVKLHNMVDKKEKQFQKRSFHVVHLQNRLRTLLYPLHPSPLSTTIKWNLLLLVTGFNYCFNETFTSSRRILLELSIYFNFSTTQSTRQHCGRIRNVENVLFMYDNKPHEIFMLVIELIMKISNMQISFAACSSYKFSLSQVSVANFPQVECETI